MTTGKGIETGSKDCRNFTIQIKLENGKGRRLCFILHIFNCGLIVSEWCKIKIYFQGPFINVSASQINAVWIIFDFKLVSQQFYVTFPDGWESFLL